VGEVLGSEHRVNLQSQSFDERRMQAARWTRKTKPAPRGLDASVCSRRQKRREGEEPTLLYFVYFFFVNWAAGWR